VRVTHPFHPLYGHDFEFVAHRQNWGEDRVHLHDENGQLFSLPAAWTDVVAADPFVVIAAARCPFTADGLLAVADLIDRFRAQRDGDRTSSRFTHKASAASPAAAARRGAGSSGVGQLPSKTGAGRASADTTAEYPHQTPRTVKTGASSRWAWTGCCADDRGTRQQAQRVHPLRRQSG